MALKTDIDLAALVTGAFIYAMPLLSSALHSSFSESSRSPQC